MFFLKSYQGANEILLAVCDSDVIGREFQHNGVTIKVNPQFYGEDIHDADEVIEKIQSSTSINAMGTNICKLLIELGYAQENTILWFNDDGFKIGHVIVLR